MPSHINTTEDEEESRVEGAAAVMTPPPSPRQRHRTSPPKSAYDPQIMCYQQVEEEEMSAIALAIERSVQKPQDVIPEQLIPTDDLTLVYIQPGVG